jgi:hypothetical protein
MAVDTKELKTVFTMFSEEIKILVTDIKEETQMEDEHFSTVVSQAISSAVQNSPRALEALYNVKLIEEKKNIADENKQIIKQNRQFEKRLEAIKERSLTIETDTKEQKKIAEEIKNGYVFFTYTYERYYLDDNNNKVELTGHTEETITIDDNVYDTYLDFSRIISKEFSGTGTTKSLSEIQLEKAQRDSDMIKTQEIELRASVVYNNKIKALDSMADTYGTFGAGGLTVSSDMWKVYFEQIKSLTNISLPASTSITKV